MGLVILGLMAYFLIQTPIDVEVIGTSAIIFLALTILFFFFKMVTDVEFDQNYMYILGESEQEKIYLKNVIRIKIISIKLNDIPIWKVNYYDNFRLEQSVTIWQNRNLERFKIAVKKANEKVEIINKTSEWGFTH